MTDPTRTPEDSDPDRSDRGRLAPGRSTGESGRTRRELLAAAAGLATALSGCGAREGTPTPTDGPGTTATTPALTATETPATTGTDATGTGEATDATDPTESGTPTPAPATVARAVVEAMAAGDYSAAGERFGPELRDRLSREGVAVTWLGLVAQKGPYLGIDGTEPTTLAGREAVAVVVSLAEGEARIRVGVAEGAVTRLSVQRDRYSPPAYADPESFAEREVTVPAEGCPLPGTLTVPRPGGSGGSTGGSGGSGDSGGPVPGVVLVHGSGPQDRDESIGPNRPFRDLAWGLATEGVAVLRYEKRTARCRVPPAEADLDRVVVDDAVAALGRLREADEVAADGTAVVGHSLGATATPRILDRDPRAVGGAMLAANARPVTAAFRDQIRHLASVDGRVDAADERRIDRAEAATSRIESGAVADDEVVLGFPGAWWNGLRAYDQVATARGLERPLGIHQGGRDYQVTDEDDLPVWRDALAGEDAAFDTYPDLNHLFQPGTEPSLNTEYTFHDNVARPVIRRVAAQVRSWAGSG